MLVRRCEPADLDAVRRVHVEAFGRPIEADLFERLLAEGDVVPALSLVAEIDGEVVGHVVCSRGRVGDREVVGLGPIGVLPGRQQAGVGLALVHAVLGAADALELPLVALLGSTEYYPRFGFVPASSLGIEAPVPAWGDHFQVRPLAAYDPSITGRFRYARAFDDI